jgi:hypothetical protein
VDGLQAFVPDVYLVNTLLPKLIHVKCVLSEDTKEVMEPQDASLVLLEDTVREQEEAHAVSVQQESILVVAGLAVGHAQQESTPVLRGEAVVLVLAELTNLVWVKEGVPIADRDDILARVLDRVRAVQEVLTILRGGRAAAPTVQLESIRVLGTASATSVLQEPTRRHVGAHVTTAQQVAIPKQALPELTLAMPPISRAAPIVLLERTPLRKRQGVSIAQQASTLRVEAGGRVLRAQLVATLVLVGQVVDYVLLESTRTRLASRDVSVAPQGTISHTRAKHLVMDVQLASTVQEQLLAVPSVPLVSTLVRTGVIAGLVG